jgi:hypothetical protein
VLADFEDARGLHIDTAPTQMLTNFPVRADNHTLQFHRASMKLPLLALSAAVALALSSAHSAEPRKRTPRATPAPDTTSTGEPKEPRSLSGRALPYKVKITAVDERAATFSSTGKGGVINVFAVTDKTVITRDAKPTTFSDLSVGSIVTGTRTRALGGKWEVASVNIQSIDATPKSHSAKKEAAQPAEKKADGKEPTPLKPAEQTEVAPVAANPPKTNEPARPEEPKSADKPGEKKPE